MTRNIVIICFCIFIIVWNLYLKKSDLLSAFPLKVIARIFLFYCIVAIILPNLPTVLNPFEPATKGIVVDSVTHKPVANCNIKVFWEIQSTGLAGGHSEAYHDYQTTTNENGEFFIPKYPKAVSVIAPLFPLILYTEYGWRRVFAYSHGYKYGDAMSDHDKSHMMTSNSEVIYLNQLNNPAEYLDNMFDLKLRVLDYGYYPSRASTVFDKNYLVDDYKLFKDRYPISSIHSNDLEGKLLSISGIMRNIGEHELSIAILSKVQAMRVAETNIQQK